MVAVAPRKAGRQLPPWRELEVVQLENLSLRHRAWPGLVLGAIGPAGLRAWPDGKPHFGQVHLKRRHEKSREEKGRESEGWRR